MGESYTTRQALTTGPCRRAPGCFPKEPKFASTQTPAPARFPQQDVESPRNLRAGPAVPWRALKPLCVAQWQARD